jgi:DNA mismatch repair protein MutS2
VRLVKPIQRRRALARVNRRAPPAAESHDEPAGATRAPVPPRLPTAVFEAPRADSLPWPDLLNPVPTLTVDPVTLGRALAFSFVAGDDGGVLATALDTAPIAASSFEPECFFHELFVEDFVRTCLSVRIGGRPVRTNQRYLLRLLAQPPADPGALALRREIWRELAERRELRTALEAVYVKLCELRKLFEGEGRVGIRGEQARRRIEILQVIRESFRAMAVPELADCSSQLQRLAGFAVHVQRSPGHARLDELLRYEDAKAYAELTLQLGADGSVRGLRVLQLREDARNRYHVSIVRQWFGRLWLWLKGYRVTDGEIVDRWLDQVFEGVCPFIPALLQLIGDIELYLSGLALRDACAARGLATCFPELVAHTETGKIEQLFNPLLFMLDVTPVPCSIELGPAGVSTLVTGPNSGGKTRLLQALGILQLCAHAGMYAPAKSAVLPRASGIFASLTQAAGAEQPEGRLGTELLRIRMLFERAEAGYLVLVDELCSGTSPSEGEELFRLVIELLAELRPIAFVSTHFLRLAAELASDPGELPLQFIQVELDAQQRPTYHFVAGVAETSLAKQTAARLGVTREELLGLLAAKRR